MCTRDVVVLKIMQPQARSIVVLELCVETRRKAARTLFPKVKPHIG